MTAMFPPGGTRFFCAVTGKAIAALNINAAIAVWEANFREVRGVRIGNSFIAENNGAKPVAKTALLPQGWRLYHALKMAAQVVASGFPHSWGPLDLARHAEITTTSDLRPGGSTFGWDGSF